MPESSQPMPTAYEPQAIEAGWYARWEQAGLFRADARSAKPHFSIAVPPPNVTGELHMGHALNGTLQDVWCRYKRMRGYEVLWLPGTDHAAIATQNVLEKRLAKEGTTKEEIGRDAFAELVDEWYRSMGATIISQFRMLGATLDWSRTRFTMDPAYYRAVQTAFVRFYEKGWMYRGPRIVNWCPHDQSAISDLEVVWKEHKDTLYYIRYDLADGSGSVVIATVRPETMLADTGVAVNPADERYRGLVGKTAILPLVGRPLPIVADDAAEMRFGTGALKVTPGHDPMDYDIGQRHQLELINGMHTDGRMNTPFAPDYDGLPALAARSRVVDDLRKSGHLLREEPYTHEVGHCDRCDSVIEPLVSEQWFLQMGELARMTIEATESGKVRWHPERYREIHLNWMRNIRDWCVSRQLWLGHRIPVYYCANGHQFAAVDRPDGCPDCGSGELRQDPDVLDTWFSSALWPFATLGWPEETEDLRAFYPTDLNSTDRGIIHLWVARMIFSGLFFMGEAPFHDVQIHCTINAPDGRRMSKSLGTGIDPRGIMNRYGADALRAWAAAVGMSSQDVRFDETRIEGFRRFGNKLWNATRLVLASLDGDPGTLPASGLAEIDRWILSRLRQAIEQATGGIEEYDFQRAVDGVYDFAWHEFCDWYLEAIKPRLKAGDPVARATSVHVLGTLLQILHPFMPFVSEELWHRLPGDRGYLMRTAWPLAEAVPAAPEVEARVGRLRELVEQIRAARAAPAGGRLAVAGLRPDEEAFVAQLAGVEVTSDGLDGATPLAWGDARLELPAATPARSDADLRRLRGELERVESRLANAGFRERAPREVVEREAARAAELRAAIERLTGDAG